MPEDAVKIAPNVYKVVLENDRVRVLDVRTKPGDTSALHGHPDLVCYAITNCTWLLKSPNGDEFRAEIKAGDTIFLDAVEHTAEDVGTSESHALLIELK